MNINNGTILKEKNGFVMYEFNEPGWVFTLYIVHDSTHNELIQFETESEYINAFWENAIK